VTLLGAAPVPVKVTLQDADLSKQHTVEVDVADESLGMASLSLSPSGAPSGDAVSVPLGVGGSAMLWLPALQPSVAEDDVHLVAFVDPVPGGAKPAIAGDGHLTNEDVTFEKHIRNQDTPQLMEHDRIPPNRVTQTTVTLNVTLTKGQVINLTVHGNSKET